MGKNPNCNCNLNRAESKEIVEIKEGSIFVGRLFSLVRVLSKVPFSRSYLCILNKGKSYLNTFFYVEKKRQGKVFIPDFLL